MPSDKKQTNVRLSTEGRNLIDNISNMYGISMTDVIEIAVRKYAQELGLWKGTKKAARGGQ